MVSRLTKLGLMILSAISLWLIDAFLFSSPYLEMLAATATMLAIIYIIFKIIIDGRFIPRFGDPEHRYFLYKASSIAFLASVLIFIIVIWTENLQALLVGFGLVAAGITISLQGVAQNFVGGLSIYLNDIYDVGDRVEISGKMGDVIDIGLLYTTVLETNEWVGGDQPTGRIVKVPNGLVLSNMTNNYTKDFAFIWDEIRLPITYDSDWKAAREVILSAIQMNAAEIKVLADQALPPLRRKYFLPDKSTEPGVFMRLTDNWIELSARYVTDPRQRRVIRNRLSTDILEGFNEKNIKIASATYEIVGFPELVVKRSSHEAVGDEAVDRES